MLEALIIGRPEEDHCVEGLAGVAVVQPLVAVSLVPPLMQHVTHVLHVDLIEGSGISLIPRETPNLAEDCLNQMTDCHARGDSVGVDNEVRRDALSTEGHVVHSVRHTNSPLLTVAGSKLVTDLRNPHSPNLDLHESLPRLIVCCNQHLINRASLVVPKPRRSVSLGSAGCLVVLVCLWHQGCLSNDDVPIPNVLSRRGEPVCVNLVVVCARARGPKLLL
mmetsp:Transcript_49801/g.119416  ORF Transcript_49801/g.119416 Transcript_49801/m.119416 type:complete len:220 (-) Transcript_49801:872-1531(-)